MRGLTDAHARHLRNIIVGGDFEPTLEYIEVEEELAECRRVSRTVIEDTDDVITWAVEDTLYGRLALALYDAGIR